MPPKKKQIKKKINDKNINENLNENVNEKVMENNEKVIENIVSLEYDMYIPKHPSRLNIYKKLYELLLKYNLKYEYLYSDNDIQKIALNIEKSCFNNTLMEHHSIEWTSLFQTYYICKVVKVYSNLNPECYINNIELMHRLFKKEILPHNIVNMSAQEIFPTKYAENMKLFGLDKIEKLEKVEIEDGIFKCRKCGSYKTTYYQMQTRSAKYIGKKSALLITSWLCYWKNSCNPSKINNYFNIQVLVN